MKILLWLYSVIGTIYFFLYMLGFEIVEERAVGALWLMMVAAPCMLGLLIWRSNKRRNSVF